MLFGSISYLNLLPFQVFLKRHITHNATHMALHHRRDVPSGINQALKQRRIHAGFISSVESGKVMCTDLGIVAHKKVYSVLLLEGEDAKRIQTVQSHENIATSSAWIWDVFIARSKNHCCTPRKWAKAGHLWHNRLLT